MREKGIVRTRERAAAKDDSANGTNGLVIGNADVAALSLFLDGHFRNDGNAHARADHTEKTAELAAFENDLRMETRAVAGGNGGIAEAVAVAQEQEGFGAEIFEGERLTGGEFVFLGEYSEEPLGQQRKSIEFVATDGKRKDGDVNGSRSQTVEKDGCNFLHDGEPNLGELAREASKARREEVGSDSRNNTDGDGTADELFAFDDIASGGFQFAKDGAGAREKRFAKLGKPNGAAEAVKEARAELIF
jgi:hypothetical protein